MANKKTTHAILVVLSDGDTYELLPGATLVAVTEEGFNAVLTYGGARFLTDEHIVGELDIAECIPEGFGEDE